MCIKRLLVKYIICDISTNFIRFETVLLVYGSEIWRYRDRPKNETEIIFVEVHSFNKIRTFQII